MDETRFARVDVVWSFRIPEALLLGMLGDESQSVYRETGDTPLDTDETTRVWSHLDTLSEEQANTEIVVTGSVIRLPTE